MEIITFTEGKSSRETGMKMAGSRDKPNSTTLSTILSCKTKTTTLLFILDAARTFSVQIIPPTAIIIALTATWAGGTHVRPCF